ncbi:MAG: hypothetical protein R6X20_03445 [Phycisphaerae bacterium]
MTKRNRTHAAMMDALAERLTKAKALGPSVSRDALRRALAMSPPPDLLLLWLKHGAGLDDRGIADRLGLPQKDVARSADDALERVRQEAAGPAPDAFDEEFVADTFGPMPPEARTKWRKAKRKPGRPKVGKGATVISVSIERELLARSDALADRLGVARSALIAHSLKELLAEAGKTS